MGFIDDLKLQLKFVKEQLKMRWEIGAEQGKELQKQHKEKVEKIKKKLK